MGQARITDLPIVGYFDVQRFPQYSPADAANWYLVPQEEGKKKVAMYPAMGRRHVTFLNRNQLQFATEPRAIFKSVNFWYAVVNNTIFRIDKNFNKIEITQGKFPTITGNVFFTYLSFTNITYACFTDGQAIYVYREDTNSFSVVTDSNAPVNPLYIVTFGNRLVVSSANSTQFNLSAINLGGGSFDPATCFTTNSAAVFAQEDDVIMQMGVLHNTLYIFTSYTTGIWQNTPSIFSGSGTTFPFKKNTSYSFDYGLTDPLSLDIDFDMMAWEGRNRGGLVQFLVSSGGKPEVISTRAVDVLLQRNAALNASLPFITTTTEGFLYSYENTIFYRVSLGMFMNFGELDISENAFSIEYNFDAGKWSRCIEVNGERNRAQKSIYFNGRHFITVEGESTVYEMSGAFYSNELRNPNQSDPQAADAYIPYPFRYERVTPIIYENDYSEFIDEYVEIDFVFGYLDFIKSNVPFPNANFIIAEQSTPDQPIFMTTENGNPLDPTFILTEAGNLPVITDTTYNAFFNPNITLYFSNDGGVTFQSADNREFSQLGQYQWRMRWYQLGPSRNRVYKLVCVSAAPIVVLGGVRLTRRASGGAN